VFALVLEGCAGLAPGGNIGQVIDVAGVGTAEVATFGPGSEDAQPNANDPPFMDRWTGARAVLKTEDGQLLVVWNGGPAACWGLASINFVARGSQLDASVGERQLATPGRCEGDRRFRAVFVPLTAAPPGGQTSRFPPQP
jgi:hypothetical protein